MKRPLKILLVGALVVVSCFFLLQHRARTAKRDLAELLPRITAITLYDIQHSRADSNTLASAFSAPFPLEEFRRICEAAPNKGGIPIWKGSSLAVFTLSDGTQRQARFSYGLGFFTVEGISGRFVGGSEFARLHSRLIQEQFVPRRQERNKAATPNQSAAANRRPAGQLDGSDNLFATVAADRAFLAAVAELGR